MENQLQEMLAEIKGFVKKELGQFQEEFRQEMKEVRTELAEVKSELAVVKSELVVVKSELAVVKRDVAELQHEVAEIRQEMRSGFAEVHRKLDTLYEQVAINTEYQAKVDDAAEKISELETDVRLIKKIVANQ